MSKKVLSNMSLNTKMILAFCLPTILLFIVNLTLYVNTSNMTKSLEEVYKTNIALNELKDELSTVQSNMTSYLNTRTSDALEAYYVSEQDYSNLVEELDSRLVDNAAKIMERNIKSVSLEYLDITNQAIEYKRGGNVEKYKELYEQASDLYSYLSDYIYSLNNEQFINNSASYTSMITALQSLEAINIITLIIIVIGNLLFVALITPSLVDPIREKELLMESHLKDAKLKYLQAQINPHFLFNTLNAGAQLAMMEGADNTGIYIQKVADFYRYNIKKNNEYVTLREEIELVEIYIYILNVRFSGDINFEKQVDDSLLDIKIPSMVLQPIVENSVNYGIRDIDWPGKIVLKVYELLDNICVSISDNGVGIEPDVVEKILSGHFHGSSMADSNGIGLDNCINRLSIYYGRHDVMDILSQGKNMGTETILYLPKEKK